MREEAHNEPAWRQEMAQKLGSLKPLLSAGGDDVNQFFDDFVREQEWGLALHVVCDYLLERKMQTAPTTAVIQQIEALHEAMGIADTCAADLRRKAW